MPADEPFVIGKAILLNEGSDVTIIATGHLVWEALVAAEALEAKGISAEVINIHTIKPLDEEAILKSVAKTGCVVTAEEHNILRWFRRKRGSYISFKQSETTRICCCSRFVWRKRNT
jgi:transketolase